MKKYSSIIIGWLIVIVYLLFTRGLQAEDCTPCEELDPNSLEQQVCLQMRTADPNFCWPALPEPPEPVDPNSLEGFSQRWMSHVEPEYTQIMLGFDFRREDRSSIHRMSVLRDLDELLRPMGDFYSVHHRSASRQTEITMDVVRQINLTARMIINPALMTPNYRDFAKLRHEIYRKLSAPLN